jgi:AcrR family transcriptional regulator
MFAVTFQRARSAEQRAARRQAILHTAEAMLTEMPVADLSLNELSRRVGLAKSNVLRYFESREAVLLELLDTAWREWLDELAATLPPGDAAVPVAERIEQVAATLTRTLVDRPILCELGSASAAVLEHNVSAEVAARFKRAALADTVALGRLVRNVVPELGEAAAERFAAATVLVAGSLWAYSRPSPAMLAAYDADPKLAAMRMDFGDSVRDLLATLLAGLLARSG